MEKTNVNEKLITDNDVLCAIYARRAVRKYKTTPVDAAELDHILRAAAMAPSGMNTQPWRFYVLRDPAQIQIFSQEILKVADKLYHELLVKMHGDDPVFHGAPVVIFISGARNDEWSPIDIGLCAQNLMLAAKSLGYDTCPVGFARMVGNTTVYKQLGVPDSERIELAVVLGYGNEQPEVHPRKENTITYL